MYVSCVFKYIIFYFYFFIHKSIISTKFNGSETIDWCMDNLKGHGKLNGNNADCKDKFTPRSVLQLLQY